MPSKFFKACVLAALAFPAAALADAGPGYASGILTVVDSHSVLFDQSGTRTNTPACGQGLSTRWAIDAATPFGQSQLAVLLSAYALHKNVTIVGAGSCAVHGDTETVRFLKIGD